MSEFKHVKELVIIRHGQSAHNVAQVEANRNGLDRYDGFIRQPDTPLTELGVQQAEATGRYLALQAPFHRVFVSPYLRAVQTAGAIAKHLPYKPELRFDERIRERESGIFAGMTVVGIQQKYPEELERQEREGRYYFRPPGGESYPDVNLRIHSFLTSLKHNFAGKRILVVCHGVVIWCFRRVLERLGEAELLKLIQDPELEIGNASVTTYITRENGKLRLKAFAQIPEPYFWRSDWNHEKVFEALCARGEKRKKPAKPNPYVELYPQSPNCALLYGPDADCANSGPLHLNPQRESWDDDFFRRVEPFIEYGRSDNKGPGRERQNFKWYRIKDWNGFAAAIGLRLPSA